MTMTRVLIVDDEVAVLRSTSLLLEEFGYDVRTCASADEVLNTVRRERPAVLLQDVRMPGLDLDRLVRDLRIEFPELPVVLFSAGMDLHEVAHRLGVKVVLDKPFEPAEIANVLAAVGAPPRLPLPDLS